MCIRPTNSRPDAFCTAAGAADAVFRNGSASPSCGCLAGRARTTFGHRYVAECPGDKLVGAGVRSKDCVAADGNPVRRCGAGILALGRNQHLDSDAAGSGRGRSTPDGRCRLAVRRFYRPNSGKLPPARERSRTFPAEDGRRIRRSSRSRAFPTMQRGAPVRRAVVGGYGCPGRERGRCLRRAGMHRTCAPRSLGIRPGPARKMMRSRNRRLRIRFYTRSLPAYLSRGEPIGMAGNSLVS